MAPPVDVSVCLYVCLSIFWLLDSNTGALPLINLKFDCGKTPAGLGCFQNWCQLVPEFVPSCLSTNNCYLLSTLLLYPLFYYLYIFLQLSWIQRFLELSLDFSSKTNPSKIVCIRMFVTMGTETMLWILKV